jgi:hypothetical protein
MSVSEARLLANRMNALKSCGPKTAEGKERSRGNALKHGLTGAGVVIADAEAAEVERLAQSLQRELKPSGDLGRTLVRRMALMAVRMDRCANHEAATLAQNATLAGAEFDAEWPEVEGQLDPVRRQMRIQAVNQTLFDPSKEACLARKYEAAAERCFFRSLKELRQIEKAARAENAVPEAGTQDAMLGSLLQAKSVLDELDESRRGPASKPVAAPSRGAPKPAPMPSPMPPTAPRATSGAFEVPFSIGRAC